MKKDYTNVYAAIFWSSLLIILVWILLKAFGFIHTPLIIEYLPFISAVFGAGAFFQMVFGIRGRLFKLESRTDKMAHGLTRLELDVTNIKSNMSEINTRLRYVEKKI